jgi:hypothetical protein
MKRIDNKTVDLTVRETLVKDTFEGYLIEGHSIPVAARMALNHYNMRDREFVEYLSEGTCERHCGKVRVKPEFRTEPSHGTPVLSAVEMRQRLGLA